MSYNEFARPDMTCPPEGEGGETVEEILGVLVREDLVRFPGEQDSFPVIGDRFRITRVSSEIRKLGKYYQVYDDYSGVVEVPPMGGETRGERIELQGDALNPGGSIDTTKETYDRFIDLLTAFLRGFNPQCLSQYPIVSSPRETGYRGTRVIDIHKMPPWDFKAIFQQDDTINFDPLLAALNLEKLYLTHIKDKNWSSLR